jgi:diguanylate cyclase (GGDEF)-like protein
MAFDRQGRLWTTGATGCFRSRAALGQSEPIFERVDIPGMGSGTRFEDLLLDGDTMWVSSYRGLAHLIEDKWRVFTKRDGLKSDAVSVLARGPRGLWIAYADALGLTRLQFDGEQVHATHFTKEDGLASDRIFAIASDPAGRLWASSDAGLDVLDQGHWRHYGTDDGLIWNDANSYALDTDHRGNVWVGTSAGLSRYSPPRFPVAASAPPVVITSIEGTSRQWDPGDHPNLPFKHRSLSVHYAALSYASEARIRFRYRILGDESEWTETRERSLRFEGLPAGHYDFQVIAAGPDDLWTPVPAQFSFSIAPPWWQSWWFLTTCLAAAVLLVSTLWRLRMRVLMAQKQHLERLVAERTAELTESHHRLEEIANSDVLTLLPNRRRFTQQFRARLELGLSLRERFALLLIDLDRFKQINDTFGHDAGDAVLVETAQRLRGTVRDADCVARLGGDEFAILIFDAYEKAIVENICERIVGYGNSGIPFNGSSLHVGTSVGIAMYPEDGDTEKSLYKAADLALYEAKRTKSGFRFGHAQRTKRRP